MPTQKKGEQTKALRKKGKLAKELDVRRKKLEEYNRLLEMLGERNSYSDTNNDATFMRMKEDAMNNGQTKPHEKNLLYCDE